MAKRSPQMASDDASNAFMAKISESLSLLGYLNNDDKANIWRFWKTVSSAVKIAVNGKGDIVETPRRSVKASKSAKEREMEEFRIQQLDRTAITIYVPVKCVDKGFRKYRVLKLANQKKIADYFETIPAEDSAIEIEAMENDLEYIDFSQLANSAIHSEGTREVVVEQVSSNDRVGTDEDLQAVEGFIKMEEKSCQQDFSHSSNKIESTDSPLKTEKSKPVKKIWPVGRPTTRSSSGARVIKDKLPEDNIKKGTPIAKISRLSFPTSGTQNTNSHSSGCDLGGDSITFYPAVKQETTEVVDEDFNITIVPMGDSVMHISNKPSSDHEPFSESSQAHAGHTLPSSNKDISAEQVYSQNSLHETAAPEYSVQISLPNVTQSGMQALDGNQEYSIQKQNETHVINIESHQESAPAVEVPATSVSESSDQQTAQDQQDLAQSHLTPRNASDIETIISALEEELKKTGSNIARISVSSAPAQVSVNDTVSSVNSVTIGDAQTSYDDPSSQTVQFIQGQEIVEVQQVDNVIWTSDGQVQIVEPHQVLNGTAMTAEGVVPEEQPVEAQYDVVEYEVLADRKQKRGRKRKPRDDSTGGKSDVVDRTCPMCHRVLNYASSMAAHMRTHTGVRPYSCGQCDRKFTTKANRDRHEATHVGLKPFQCTQCSKSFTEKRSLTIHMRTHTGERPFVCDICGQKFTQKCTLVVHMDRHTNKKGHLCDLCGKAFRQKCQLDVHVKRHNRQAMYPCNECSTKCYTRGDLVRHMIKHTGERPFRCKECPRAFTRKQYLIDHENQHYDRKPYRCSVCSLSFHDMGSCHRHIRKHRQEEDGESSKDGTQTSTVLSQGAFHRILEGTQIGQILKLDDGTDAVVKAVTSEADGSTVYHITCLGKSEGQEKPTIEATSIIPDSNSVTVTEGMVDDSVKGEM